MVLELAVIFVLAPADAAGVIADAAGNAAGAGSVPTDCPAVGERGATAIAAAVEVVVGSSCVDNVNAGDMVTGVADSALTVTGDSAVAAVTEPRGVCSAEDDWR